MYFEKLQEAFKNKQCDEIQTLITNNSDKLKNEKCDEICYQSYYYNCLLNSNDFSKISDIISWVKTNLDKFTSTTTGNNLLITLISYKDKGILDDSQFSSDDYNTIVNYIKDFYIYKHYQMIKLFDKMKNNLDADSTTLESYINTIETIFLPDILKFLLNLSQQDLEIFIKNIEFLYIAAGKDIPEKIIKIKNIL